MKPENKDVYDQLREGNKEQLVINLEEFVLRIIKLSLWKNQDQVEEVLCEEKKKKKQYTYSFTIIYLGATS